MSAAEPPQPTDAPAPGSDDFDPKQHLWDGTNWWSADRQRWWDGSQWRSVDAPAVAAPAASAPPPPPQVSPDGRFYWDGQRWVPMQAPVAPQAQAVAPQIAPAYVAPVYGAPKKGHAVRNVSFGCLGLIALLIVIGIAASGGSKNNQTTLKWTVDGRSTTTSTVGGTDAVQVTVTNDGSNASDLILYLNASDDWFKHHVITDPDGCTINKNLERLECGPLAAGETKTINVAGSPKDAGNFNFELDVADEEQGSGLLYPDKGALTWSEAVTA
jgi:hypothetical protein